jgi:hypothetical protein
MIVVPLPPDGGDAGGGDTGGGETGGGDTGGGETGGGATTGGGGGATSPGSVPDAFGRFTLGPRWLTTTTLAVEFLG